MPDIISLLPDSVANQIAAGEVVQRPASVVKELLENAIDAGASVIKLVVKDSGKTLIQVTDNGKGMSETDARMSFERHATSKIKKTEDLFHIHTKGFRGEALASIAAVAQVELKTRQSETELGTHVEIEASKIKTCDATQCPVGSTFIVKNLFYNVPARRYFLKSEAIELRHIIDELQRVALTHPDIEFAMTHNGAEVFTLPQVPLRQRIVHVFGNKYNEKLVPVEEQTDIVSVSGFVGKPDASKKTRGEQYFFINNRFIKNTYLNHAVVSAFQDMLQSGHYPLYLLYLEIDPAQIDINIHPTKTEIKFQDERAVYAIIHAAVRRALGKFNISPSLDFDQETSIRISPVRAGQDLTPPRIDINPGFNPFASEVPEKKRESSLRGWFDQRERNQDGWQELLQITNQVQTKPFEAGALTPVLEQEQITADLTFHDEMPVMQLMRKFIVCASPKGLMVIDQQRAHQRILFEKFARQIEAGKGSSQQLLFPQNVEVNKQDFVLIQENIETLEGLGFTLIAVDDHSFEILGVPVDAGAGDGQKILEDFLEQWKNEAADLKINNREKIAWAMAATSSVRYGQMLTTPEMHNLVSQLMQCNMPFTFRDNRSTLVSLNQQELEQQFR